MRENYRQFDVTDPFGRCWQVEFRWQQNAISIRHADAVDCKYYLSAGQEKRELIVALGLADLASVAAARGREVSDAWCLRLASLHVRHLLSSWTDVEHPLVVATRADLERHSLALIEAETGPREKAALSL